MSAAPTGPVNEGRSPTVSRAAAARSGGPIYEGRTSAAAARASAHPYMAKSSTNTQKVSFGKQKENPAADGFESQRESKASRYTKVLQMGANGVDGILAIADKFGRPLLPYEHQRRAVKLVADKKTKFMLLAHDAGLGKTATAFQIMAAIELLIGGGCRTIVTVPPSTLPQWEETAHTWLNSDRIKPETILVTNKASLVSYEKLATVRVLVISRHLLARLYKTCFHYEEKYEQNERGNWISKWIRTDGKPLHPLFKIPWDLLCVDEAHFMRNPHTEWCVSHEQLSDGMLVGDTHVGGCSKRIALTATPICNKPLDMVGLSKAIGADHQFRDKYYWSTDRTCRTIRESTAHRFRAHTDRARDTILSLKPLNFKTFSCKPGLTYEEAAEYNAILGDARQLRLELETHRATAADLQKLMAMLQRMQQMLVSPLLAKTGAQKFKENEILYTQSATRETGLLRALYDRIKARQAEGHNRIMIAANHVTIMKIAKLYLENKEPGIAEIFMYEGSKSLQQRQAEKQAFLVAPKSILFLSIGAGGTGLHLVPGCNCGIFWGSRPFSPAQIWQTAKRIHRIGQENEVFIDHIIPYGSVDWAIDRVHEDKSGLAAAVIDNDWSHFGEDTSSWKKTGRIVDSCSKMDEDGNFPPEPPPEPTPEPDQQSVNSKAASKNAAGTTNTGGAGVANTSAPYVPPAGPPLVVGFPLGPAVMQTTAPPSVNELLNIAQELRNDAAETSALPPL